MNTFFLSAVSQMTTIETDKRRRAVKIANAVNSIEGVLIPDKTNEFFLQWINGKISDEKLTELISSLCKMV